MANLRLTTCFGLSLLVVACGAGSLRAYEYADDFSTDKAALDSYRHSTFWSKERVPLPEPYLFYIEIDRDRGLAFSDYKGQNAELGYRFPLASASAERTFKGVLTVDVSFPSNAEISQTTPGRLAYKTSPDGMGWSAAQALEAGHCEIPITSATGVGYILFSGTRAVIDNLAVFLYSTPVTIRVPQDFPTIQAAIDAAEDGDVIEIARGTYSGPGYRDIQFQGKAITVRGTAGPSNTIIDCGGATASAEGGHRGFYFHQSEGSDSILSDVTIQGGRVFGSEVPPDPLRDPSSAYPIGGGIYCQTSSPTIVNCIIRDCGAELGGGIGGVDAEPMIADCVIEECIAGGLGTAASGGRGAAIALIANSNATLTNCILRDNSAYRNSYGAGLYFFQSAATVVGCTISSNTALSVRGGGAYCGGTTTDVTFTNCVISQNRADAGAGICAEWVLDTSLPASLRSKRCRVNVTNCTIARNALTSPTAGNAAAGVQSSGAEVFVTSSILWSNTGKALLIADSGLSSTVTYSDVEGGCQGTGNLNTDPLFATPSLEDYHLKSKYGRYVPASQRWVADSVHSPCIDTGDPSVSVGDEPPPNGNRINMGAYGGTKQASNGPEHVIYHVDNNGGRDSLNTGRSHEQAFATIQHAIDVARDGDTVLVWPGAGAYREKLIFKGKAITVQSATDAAVLSSSDYAVSFYHGEGPGSILANFVISGCGVDAILCQGASPTLRNLTIVGNRFGIFSHDGGDPNITNCILWSNTQGDLQGCKARFSNIQHDTADTRAGNIQRDPMFADPQRSDYHLKSRAGRYAPLLDTWVTDGVTSPCIDAGNPKDDCRGERMPNGGRVNMGAYGGTPFASLSG
ncbi:MAG: right-handed parallel beta-helix repeat-containing protein [Sedimentisphaerales bacterium]|nr:right-handed parallel beta-helix repeat-containing protein [Sedimentisphaerales bacterium]